jgi:hypothetical protein
MRTRFFALVVALACGATACSPRGAASDGPTAPVRGLLSNRGVAILSNSTKVEVYRIESPLAAARPPRPASGPATRATSTATTRPDEIAGYTVLARGADQGPDFGRRLAAVFLDARTYSFDSAKGCMFDPGVVFRVYRDAEWLDLVLCYTCAEFRIVVPQPDGTTHRAGEDFDHAKPVLMRLAKDALPSDSAIQGLGLRE